MSKNRIKKARRFIEWLQSNSLTVKKYRELVAIQKILGHKDSAVIIGGYSVKLKNIKTYGVL